MAEIKLTRKEHNGWQDHSHQEEKQAHRNIITTIPKYVLRTGNEKQIPSFKCELGTVIAPGSRCQRDILKRTSVITRDQIRTVFPEFLSRQIFFS